jgi:hypothetical protein
MNGVKYQFYATLLDAFQGWLSSSEIYNDYWGFSEDPSKTEDEFEKEQFESLINRINRVPMKWEDSEAADKGTAFNEAVDCLIANRKSEKMILKSNAETNTITADYNNRTFIFPVSLIREFAEYFKGGISNVYTEGILATKYGNVLLYGYIDELSPLVIHDIKTTGKYKVGKFRNNWQHVVYPFCMNQQGNPVNDFEYNVAVLGSGSNYSTFTEYYRYDPEKDINRLQLIVESLIDCIELNRNLITDTKIFNHVTN